MSATNNEFEPIYHYIEEAGIDLPRHKRKQLAAVLLDLAAPPPTRTQIDNLGNALDGLGKSVQTVVDHMRDLRGALEEEPGKLMRARRERLMFALSVMKRVEPNFLPLSQEQMQMNMGTGVAPQPDPEIAKVRAVAGGILDRFMGGEGEHLISDEPITQQQREQVTMALDLLTSIPDSHHGGDPYCDHVRTRACKTIHAYLDPESAKHEAAWAAAGAPA